MRTQFHTPPQSFLVDLGCSHDIIGQRTARQMARTSRMFVQHVHFKDRRQRLRLHGVGEDAAPREAEVSMPIAVKGNSSNVAYLDVFQASIASGSGADMPAILGANTMQDRDAAFIHSSCSQDLKGIAAHGALEQRPCQWGRHLQVT